MAKIKTKIIAEIGSVHDGSFGNAQKLIEAAKECGADIVKFQIHIPEAETLKDAPTPPYFKGEPRWDYFKRTGFSESQWRKLKKYAEDLGIEFLASSFSIEAAKLLEKLGVKRHKVPSGEVTNLPLLEFLAKTKKPILLSSGMSNWQELDRAVKTVLKYNSKLTVLQCTTEYPRPYEKVGLNVMLEMKKRYNLPVGLSDHTLTNYAAFAATVLGASVIEKHFTLSRHMYGSDAAHSLEPDEFKDLVEGVRAIEVMMKSKVNKNDISPFKEMKRIFEKSIVTLVDIPKGKKITSKMLELKKPGTGFSAIYLPKIIGKRAKKFLKADKILKKEDFV